MGSCSSKQPNENGFFLEGPQGFTYDEKVAVFEKKNGLLFRLVNTEEKQWAYYNDTSKFEFHITVTYSAESSDLVALGKTDLQPNPEGGFIAKVIVYPGLTEPFVQGNMVGFDATVNAVLLTTEYQEQRREEKKQAKKAAKEAAKEQENNEPQEQANYPEDTNDNNNAEEEQQQQQN